MPPLARRRASSPMTRWEPFSDMEELYNWMARLVESSPFGRGQSGIMAWSPPVDVEDRAEDYLVEADLPGVSREDISVEFRDGELTIRGEVKERNRSGSVREQARRTGRFDYRLVLPREVDADKIEARLTDGVLTVRLPKADQKPARTIEVASG
jgi:HSP20 family protein